MALQIIVILQDYSNLENRTKELIHDTLYQLNKVCYYNLAYFGISVLYREEVKEIFQILFIINLGIIAPSAIISIILPRIIKLRQLKQNYRITIPIFAGIVLIIEFVVALLKISS